jgi:hypothetical protein
MSVKYPNVQNQSVSSFQVKDNVPALKKKKRQLVQVITQTPAHAFPLSKPCTSVFDRNVLCILSISAQSIKIRVYVRVKI